MAARKPVTVTAILPNIIPPLRKVALDTLRKQGYTPVHAHLWRVVPIPGGFEIDPRPEQSAPKAKKARTTKR